MLITKILSPLAKLVSHLTHYIPTFLLGLEVVNRYGYNDQKFSR